MHALAVSNLNGATRDPSVHTLTRLSGALHVSPIVLLRHYLHGHRHASDPREAPACVVRSQTTPGDSVAFIPHAPRPDPSLIAPGETFTQTWTLQNVGSVAWRARSLVRLDEELVIARRVGTFTTVWHMRDERGQASFPRDFFLQTVVTVIGF